MGVTNHELKNIQEGLEEENKVDFIYLPIISHDFSACSFSIYIEIYIVPKCVCIQYQLL